ncbi:MAG: hypothetical protein ACXVRK_11470 [Gaiellaceae bacterium]
MTQEERKRVEDEIAIGAGFDGMLMRPFALHSRRPEIPIVLAAANGDEVVHRAHHLVLG